MSMLPASTVQPPEPGVGFGHIGIRAIDPEFNADAAGFGALHNSVEFIVLVGVVMVKHEIAAVQLHGGEAVIGIKGRGAQHIGGKFHGAGHVPDQQVKAKASSERP